MAFTETTRKRNQNITPPVLGFKELPSRFEISELCILGNSLESNFRCARLQTIKAFMGRLTLSSSVSIIIAKK